MFDLQKGNSTMPLNSEIAKSRHFEKAQFGRAQIEEAILELLQTKLEGLSNAEVATHLGLETGATSGQKNYLTWSILQGMVQRQLLATSAKPNGQRGTHYTLPPK
jgi:hypothetical protein